MSRRFQFSLRALLVAITATCVVLGWIVERANRRGAAIDAIVRGESIVSYRDDVYLSGAPDSEYVSHFWLDVKRMPVTISIAPDITLDAALGERLRNAVPIDYLYISNVRDDDLRHLQRLNKGCSAILFSEQKLSGEELAAVVQRMPNVQIANVSEAKTP